MLICVPLLIATYFDLRFREVPAWLTLTTMLGSSVFAILRGFWMPTLLTVALCLVSEMTIPAQRRSFAALFSAFAAIFYPASAVLCLALFTIWFLWDLDKMGGADMKLMSAVILASGSPIVLLSITLIGGLQGLVAYFCKQTSVPFVFSIFLGTLLYTVVPLILK
jgi:Flp pilus assembly protein protease CpaA